MFPDPANPNIHSRRTIIGVGLIIGGLTIAYLLLFPTLHLTPDAINYLPPIEQHNVFELWHTQHLFGLFPGYGVYQLLGGSVRAWQVMRIVNALLAGATLSILFWTLFELTHRIGLSTISTLLLWFSYGFWHYNSDTEVYSIGLFAVALLLLTFVDFLGKPGAGRAMRAGSAAAFAILTHQFNIELAGLIGVALIWLAWHTRTISWRNVFLYAVVPAVAVPLVYIIGWLSVTAYWIQTGQPTIAFFSWVTRYFEMAHSGAAAWGTSLHFNTLPAAAYTILASWMLPPVVHGIPPVQGLLIASVLLGAAIVIFRLPTVLRDLSMTCRLLAIVCIVTILANAFSMWWWQVGNIKFVLFMEIPAIVLMDLFASQALTEPHQRRRISLFSLGLISVGLIGNQVFYALPYETRGGVFAVLNTSNISNKSVWFENPVFAVEYGMISTQPGHILPADFCGLIPHDQDFSNSIWVVNANTTQHCPALANMTYLGDFQADRSRDQWQIFESK